jgi:hypothetical protein
MDYQKAARELRRTGASKQELLAQGNQWNERRYEKQEDLAEAFRIFDRQTLAAGRELGAYIAGGLRAGYTSEQRDAIRAANKELNEYTDKALVAYLAAGKRWATIRGLLSDYDRGIRPSYPMKPSPLPDPQLRTKRMRRRRM